MKATTIAITALLALSGTMASAQSRRSLTYWFDKPTTLSGQAVWYGGHPERWTTKKPEAAGDTGQNPDPEWESQSLPIGNGSLGANIMGSVEAERITFNEKSLWRGGPNTSNDASRYWNVNKQSAQVIGQIRDAFAAATGTRRHSSRARTSTARCPTSRMPKTRSASATSPQWANSTSKPD